MDPILQIDGKLLARMIRSGAHALQNRREEIDRLNVYPVPDGDTGSNMSMTVQPAEKLIELDGNVSEIASKAASLFLRAARGNSGVILSLFFRGFSRGLSNLETATAKDITEAFAIGVTEAYKAVQTPKEGTILTVMRKSSEVTLQSDDIGALFFEMLQTAAETLEQTPEMLPVLKQAGVVDSGGTGFVAILYGMYLCLFGSPVELCRPGDTRPQEQADFTSFDTAAIVNPYCTECIITKRDDLTEQDVTKLRSFILDAGDSAVFADDTDIIKIHVHTKDPGRVLSEALHYGTLYTVKVENMKNQHTELVGKETVPHKEPEEETVQAVEPTEEFGFVAVVMGDGIKAVFSDFGVGTFVEGGQSMNPSTDQLINAVSQTPARNVFLLPNNGNVCLVAEQAARLVTDRNVFVIPSVSVPQGLSALMVFDPETDAEQNVLQMKDAMKVVRTAEMTYAAHDATVNGQEVRENQTLGLLNHKVICATDSHMACLQKLAERIRDSSYITVFFGSDIAEEEAEEAATYLQETIPEAEVSLLYGGQPLYYYIISAE